MPDVLVVTRSVRIPRHELQVSFSPSGGPGGQHANRSHTRVELRLDLESSSAFGPVQRQRVLDRLGPEIRVVVDEQRSQTRNRTLAEQRLVERLREALHVDPPRRPTKPTRTSKERRLISKQRRSDIKQTRRKPGVSDPGL
ncbi:MAG TPA: alternative ribosome rescue aminoacyl-tRNA hydrolase ArfB [Ilumatobacter sp.]|nr:alternative ribosome rescue aminoacyl-tRNA hydrolase ArfB [Ilumatobacter sp.]